MQPLGGGGPAGVVTHTDFNQVSQFSLHSLKDHAAARANSGVHENQDYTP